MAEKTFKVEGQRSRL